jgi:hypothetical protein
MGSEALERIRRRTEAHAAKAQHGGAWQWLKGAALALAALSAVGTLVGYGAARGYDSVFGISYALWFDTPMDLLAMSGDAVVGLLVTWPSQLVELDFWSGLARLGVLVALMVLTLSTAHWAGTSTALRPLRAGVASKLTSAATWLTTSQPHFRRNLPRLLAVASLSGVAGSLSALTGVVLLMLAVCVVALLPLVGHMGASQYAQMAIVEPASCISPIAVRLRGKSGGIGAPCVEVVDPATGKVHAGRLILARGSRVFLYSKVEDRASALTIKDGAISTGSKLMSAYSPAEH